MAAPFQNSMQESRFDCISGPSGNFNNYAENSVLGLSLSSCEVKCGDEHVQSALLQGGVLMLIQTRMLTRRISSRSMGCLRSPWTPLPVMTPPTGASPSSRPSRCARELSIDCMVPLASNFHAVIGPVTDVLQAQMTGTVAAICHL